MDKLEFEILEDGTIKVGRKTSATDVVANAASAQEMAPRPPRTVARIANAAVEAHAAARCAIIDPMERFPDSLPASP